MPLIKHWPKDGGAFVTLPQVYTEDIDKPGVQHSNLGMYRIQLTGNDYILNKEVGFALPDSSRYWRASNKSKCSKQTFKS